MKECLIVVPYHCGMTRIIEGNEEDPLVKAQWMY